MASSNAEVPQLFDEVKARMAIQRAARQGAATFLLERAQIDLIERLETVLRSFDPALDLGTPGGLFATALKRAERVSAIDHVGEVAPGDPSIAYRRIDGPDLKLNAGRYGLIVSGLWLQRVNDVPGILAQVRRALKPDGLFLAAFVGGDSLAELRDCLLTAESEITGSAALRVFPFVDVRAAGQLLQRAGLTLPVTDSEKLTIRYGSFFALAAEWRAMASSASLLRRPGTPPLTRRVLFRAAELYAERHADADGRLRANVEIVWMSGWAPHESQQKPLKPGSAKARLEDALADIASRKKFD
ncbi:MAG: methyltransferase domain-containing protein [Methylobacterium sp.]|nr:methyltransferase domain-containing protein [Methylobacterium sp.]